MKSWQDIEAKGLENLRRVKATLDDVREINLALTRRWFTTNTSIGKLSVNGLLYCYTLEDVTREGEKIKKETAIPYGVYLVLMTVSAIAYKWNTPGNLLPLLKDVPKFSGIRIHPGTKKGNTEGCVLVGFTRSEDEIGKSQAAFWPLFDLLLYAHDKGYPVKIKVTNHERQVTTVLLVVFGGIMLLLLIRYLLNLVKR